VPELDSAREHPCDSVRGIRFAEPASGSLDVEQLLGMDMGQLRKQLIATRTSLQSIADGVATSLSSCRRIAAETLQGLNAATSASPKSRTDATQTGRAVTAPLPGRGPAENNKATWQRLESLDDDLLDSDCPRELVDAELRHQGQDPETLAERGVDAFRDDWDRPGCDDEPFGDEPFEGGGR
jgi:hypothetical protein